MYKRLLNVNYLYNYITKRQAGHSKWANIKHTKSLKDNERSKLFTKLSQQIKVAINEGGSANPSANLRLEQIIAQAKRSNMPAATIDSVIKSTQKDKTQMKSFTFEIKGPGNCIILCEVCSPNVTKTKQDIASMMKKHSCRYSESGGRHFFDHKGVIQTEVPSAFSGKLADDILEAATNHAIECEAEDVVLVDDNLLQFTSDPHSFMKVQKNLEELKYNIVEASLDYIPIRRIELSDDDMEKCSRFFDKLSSVDDVVGIYNNIA
ncbi:hypothetical protein PPYR_03084 [Photinus pyralis]|uniref:Transcriptional regulatory protein n=3 Tax=Photinus pyralis TaxID=7054 RepID=A0A1Y1MEI7_PHOPY|nr:translational activator of cytochrome c oxidase 1-like [Photinus pyralis]XP_031331535.1 translational activator of cytochrome c oxidase 1-like [Photinus pyralis]KAB0791254.1 hypothetical protein PPYR_03054 [Photinus pyralis]KAB0791284.1 hypothetical protein PPYR_03084 [Photinus pyralis]